MEQGNISYNQGLHMEYIPLFPTSHRKARVRAQDRSTLPSSLDQD